ncbi:MAG: hypothetical protein HY904_18900 [Deltaproteobacteria bacterium]|nr:hypothetical protein [Deltaproteobacteria bacterium]
MMPWGAIAGAVAAMTLNKREGQSRLPAHAAVMWLACVAGFIAAGRWPSLPSLVGSLTGLAVCLVPWWFARRVCVPLGWHRAAWYLASADDITWTRDHCGAGALAAAWAVLHQRGDRARALGWVRDRLARESPLRGAGVVALGLLEAAQGRRDQARAWLTDADATHELATPAAARRLAAEWRALDAAERGDWDAVVELGRSASPRTALTRWLGHVGERLQGASLERRWSMAAWWLLAGRWRVTWPLMRRAWAPAAVAEAVVAPVAAFRPPEDVAARTRVPLLALAQARLDWVSARAAASGDDVAAAAAAWDSALAHPDVKAWMHQRAALLGVTDLPGARAALEDDVVERLLALARGGSARLPEAAEGAGTVATRVTWEARHALLEEVELACEAFRTRAEVRAALPSPDEWAAWLGLRDAVDAAMRRGGPGFRRLAFRAVNQSLTPWAVWLWNERKERPLAHEAFRWMATQASDAGDESAQALHEKNAACGI